jgi:hypothetical protein
MKSQWVLSFLIAIGLAVFAYPANAQDYSKIRIVRLSFVEGDVQFERPGEDWEDARLNLPIQEGVKLRTAEGYAEVEFEDSLTLRLGTNATVEFSELGLQNGGRVTKLAMPQGTAILSAKLKRGDAASVVTPSLNLTIPHDSRFRMDIGPDESWVSVFHGKVEIESSNREPSLLSGGHTLRVDASGSHSPEIVANPPQDDFDKWVMHREDSLNASQNQASSVLNMNSYTAGSSDLFDYGVWTYIPGYGAGWMPYGAGLGWMPFVNGQWQFMGGLGWNWISQEPWGWLPYHFGSWVNAPGVGWTWLPVGTTVWTPATAHWVHLNNQLGWVPSGPVLTSKPTKAQLAALPSTAILAAPGTGGAIAAGTRLPLPQSGTKIEMVAAPPQNFGAPGKVTATAAPVGNASAANAKTFSHSVPEALAGPASISAPSANAAQSRVTGLSSAPRALMAPHTPPAPTIDRGTSALGAVGSRSGGRATMTASSSAGPASRSAASPAPSSTGSSSHSSGSTGSSGGHR